MVVDFPAPLGPTKPVTCPGSTVNDIPSSATAGPNLLRKPLTSIVASMPGRLGSGGGERRHAGERSCPSLAGATPAAGIPRRRDGEIAGQSDAHGPRQR